MLILGVSLFVIGFIMAMFAMGMDSFGLVFLAFVFIFAGLGVFLHHETHVGHVAHTQAYKDLKAEGWNVTNDDVQWAEDQVQIGCLTFGLHKLNGKFQVTTDRSSALGGGYVIKSPSIQPRIATLCQEAIDG